MVGPGQWSGFTAISASCIIHCCAGPGATGATRCSPARGLFMPRGQTTLSPYLPPPPMGEGGAQARPGPLGTLVLRRLDPGARRQRRVDRAAAQLPCWSSRSAGERPLHLPWHTPSVTVSRTHAGFALRLQPVARQGLQTAVVADVGALLVKLASLEGGWCDRLQGACNAVQGALGVEVVR